MRQLLAKDAQYAETLLKNLNDISKTMGERLLGKSIFSLMSVIHKRLKIEGETSLWEALNGKVENFNGILPAGRLRDVMDTAFALYLKDHPGTSLSQKDFILGLFWKGDGPSTSIPKRNGVATLVPVLSETSKYMILAEIDSLINAMTQSGRLGNHIIETAALRNKAKAIEARELVKQELDRILADPSNPDYTMSAKETKIGFDSSLDGERAFFLTMKRAIGKGPFSVSSLGIYLMNLFQMPIKELLSGPNTRNIQSQFGVFYNEEGQGIRFRSMSNDADLGKAFVAIRLNALYETANGIGFEIDRYAPIEKLVNLIRGTDYNHDLGKLLAWNGLVEVQGSRIYTRDGYVYFEVKDPENPSARSVLCRVYQGSMGTLAKGIELFVDARADGNLPNSPADPNHPVTDTGHIYDIPPTVQGGPTIYGLRSVIERLPVDATDVEYFAALNNWLSGKERITTTRLDSFYGLLISPPP